MAITFETTEEVIEFLNGLDGAGLILTDEDLIRVELLENYDFEE